MANKSPEPGLLMTLFNKTPGTPGGVGEYEREVRDSDSDGDGDEPALSEPDPMLKYAADDVMDAFKSGKADELKDALFAFVQMCR